MRIRVQNQVIRALVYERRIKVTQLALTLTEAAAQFVVTKPELIEALGLGLLGYAASISTSTVAVWRLERLYARRRASR